MSSQKEFTTDVREVNRLPVSVPCVCEEAGCGCTCGLRAGALGYAGRDQAGAWRVCWWEEEEEEGQR